MSSRLTTSPAILDMSDRTNGSAAVEVKATDAARRKARELGVILAEVEGTGADGQVTIEDVRKKGDG